MDFSDLLVAVMADLLAASDAIMSSYMDVPANASGPLDPNIVLTPLGSELVHEVARLAIAWSGTIALASQLLM